MAETPTGPRYCSRPPCLQPPTAQKRISDCLTDLKSQPRDEEEKQLTHAAVAKEVDSNTCVCVCVWGWVCVVAFNILDTCQVSVEAKTG